MIKQMYGGELIFDDAEHLYTFDGQPVPGVTTILKVLDKPALVPWAAKMASLHWMNAIKAGRTDYDVIEAESRKVHDIARTTAADIGTEVHAYAEAHFKNQPKPELTSDKAKRGVEAFHKWLDSHTIKALASERLVFSKEFYYAGTCDFVAEIDGILCVGDIKTSSGIYNEARFQTAAYQHAMQEEKGMTFGGRWVVRFDKNTGKFQAKFFNNFETDFGGFKAALSIHRTLQKIKQEKSA
jgi:hypothetical protein